MLDDLDRELERRGHRFVRYADDCNIHVSSPRAGQRMIAGTTGFIERRLKLKVNKGKSASRPLLDLTAGWGDVESGAGLQVSARLTRRRPAAASWGAACCRR